MTKEIKAEPPAEILDQFKELRKPFPDACYGKLFRAWDKEEGKRAPKAYCQECGSKHTTAHGMHLDYVGHGAVTDRLLSVDPHWSWEPLSFEENGLPRFVRAGAGNALGFWIKLTVCDVTRLGYGSVTGDASDAEKQLIGDAIRNAAMRFGVALDLWSKEELESNLDVPNEAVSPVAAEKRNGKAPKQTGVSQGLQERAAEAAWTPDEKAQIDQAFDAPVAPLVMGIPIDIAETWATLRLQKAAQPFKEKTWEEISTGAVNGKAEQWLARLVEDARAAFADGRKSMPLCQKAVLCYDAMQKARQQDALEAQASTIFDGPPWEAPDKAKMEAPDVDAGALKP